MRKQVVDGGKIEVAEVETVAAVTEVLDGIVAAAEIEDEAVIAVAAGQDIVAGAALETIVAIAGS